MADVTEREGETTREFTGEVGQFVWATVDYRDGFSVMDDPVTALDERNNNPTDTAAEQHKYRNRNEDGTPDNSDTLFYNSDLSLTKGADNAVQKDPEEDEDIPQPSTTPVLVERMVYENVPSTGYVGLPLELRGEMGLSYQDGKGGTATRDTIGGPDGASFVFAEEYDEAEHDFYDMVMTDSDNIEADSTADPPIEANDDPDDKMGQLAAQVVIHFDAEAAKNSYIIEITDPDAEVAVGPVRVTITVVNVNEAPSAPSVRRGDTTTTPTNNAPEFAAATDTRTVPENTIAGEDIGAPVAATDADAGDTLTYTLGGDDMASFAIGETDGQLMTLAALDYETQASYSVTVTATDTAGATDTITVTITVTDVTTGLAIADTYDANEDGVIGGREVAKAVQDHFAGNLGGGAVAQVVQLYFRHRSS